ncbi:hypothetical protein H9P43_002333 [Blastocladiella emersonii ATCC 22665]|nr:hypothetical protein H9P43_002333 [Blastocladiella emersonii ATCC 22665]
MPLTLEATVTRLVAVAQVKARSRTTSAPTVAVFRPLATRVVKSPRKAFTLARKTLVLIRGPYTPSGDKAFVKLFHKRRYKFSHKTKHGKRGDESDSMTIADARGLLVTSVKSAASNYVLQLQNMTIAPLSDRSATQAPVIILYVLVPLLLIEDLAPMIQLLHFAANDAGTIKQYVVKIIAAIAAFKFVMAQAHEGAHKSMDRDKATATHKAMVGALHAQDAFDAREVAEELLSVTIGPEKKK